ncbi:MAG TPA: PaaX family transcriptional regulator C-terminal domain-containing protein [Patescibacteria group bacterium]|nr:PaaX family transcriptional regulator C-terminal domain-containing protein [Patescibacteria group bacterium]
MGQKDISEKVKSITEGVISTSVDLALVSIFYGIEFASSGYSGRGFGASEKALDKISQINYKTIKRSVYYLKRKGLIKTVKQKINEGLTLPSITKEGKDRLNIILPRYHKKRTWDGKIYLITYDFPIDKNVERDNLRDYIKKLGCGILQKSVWITPYNPTGLIESFVKGNNIDNELILISSLEKGETVGGLNLSELLEKVYGLEELNNSYERFINLIKSREIKSKDQIAFSYLAILRNDPQLPFEILPYDWKGDRAYRLFKNILKNN